MRIDRTHRPWLVFSLAVTAGAGAWYVYDVTRGSGALNGPSGGSVSGLTFGIAGSLFMLFAGLLSLRKRVRTWRIGSAQFWMRGHLWLGLLALPLIWFHGGFRHGGTVTTILMWLLYAIVLSGIVGAVLQHFLPRQMTQTIGAETVYEQIPQVLELLSTEADQTAAVCGPGNGQDLEAWRAERAASIESSYQRSYLTDSERQRLLAGVQSAPVEGSGPLREFYAHEVRPFIVGQPAGTMLADSGRAESVFAQQRLGLPRALHEPLDELERICVQVRELLYHCRPKSVVNWSYMIAYPENVI
jgi:hypothetical protein